MTSPTGILAPNAKYYVNTVCGTPAVDGFMATFDANTGTPKPTYADPALTIPNPVVMRIGSDGAVEGIQYWDTSSGYYTYRAYDKNGGLIENVTPFPITLNGGGGNITISLNSTNYARNEQFAFWTNGNFFDNAMLPVGTTPIADDWFFTRSNGTAAITIQQYNFPAGAGVFPFNPTSALRYTVSGAASDTNSDISQRYESVQTLSNTQVTESIWAETLNIGATASLTLFIIQNFGIGGSSPITTIIDTFTITDTAQQFSATFTVPSVSGSTIGTSGDYLEIGWRLNPAQLQDIIISDDKFQNGVGTGPLFPYITENQQYVKILPTILESHGVNNGTDIIGMGSISTPAGATQTLTQYLQASFFESGSESYLIGWLFELNPNQFGQTITNTSLAQYVADQTILLTSSIGQIEKNSFTGGPLVLNVLTSNEKFGILQIIETINSAPLINSIASLAANITATTSTTFKIALLGWNGTVNMQSLNPIAAWNAAGTDPTLVSGWNYVATTHAFTVDPSSFYAGIYENLSTTSSYTSFGVMVWDDSADMLASSSASFFDISLVQSENASRTPISDVDTVLSQCRRYLFRTYDPSTTSAEGAIQNGFSFVPQSAVPDPISGYNPIFPQGILTSGTHLFTSQNYFFIQFPVAMYRDVLSSDVIFYNPSNGSVGSAEIFVPFSGSFGSGTGFNPVASFVYGTQNGLSGLIDQTNNDITVIGTITTTPLAIIHAVVNTTLGV